MLYSPIDTLKPVADNIWIVDGPAIRFGMPWPKFSFPTRATIIRLQGGRLFVHSPTPLTSGLKVEIAALGQPQWIIGPNRIHYWWIPEWKNAYLDASVYLAPRIREQGAGRINFETAVLSGNVGYPWDDEIKTLCVPGSYMTEFDFFHKTSRTLILTDIMMNFEAEKVHSSAMRLIYFLTGVLHPNGGMPRDMRLTFGKHKEELRQAVEAMIALGPERIILAHGKWYQKSGGRELQRAFGWLLGESHP